MIRSSFDKNPVVNAGVALLTRITMQMDDAGLLRVCSLGFVSVQAIFRADGLWVIGLIILELENLPPYILGRGLNIMCHKRFLSSAGLLGRVSSGPLGATE
jgi:hypothetical protein